MPYFSVSAKTSENVEVAFNKVADLAFERYTKEELPLPEIKPVQLIEKTEEKKGCFC